MKKKLEAELISIAHRILKLKNKEDVRELHHEAQRLYEKLSVLLFVEENFESIKPTIGIQEIEDKLEKSFAFDEKIEVGKIEPENTETEELEILTPNAEAISKETEEKTTEIPQPEIVVESVEKETVKEQPIIDIPKSDKKQISFDEILNSVTPEPIFERVSASKNEPVVSEEISKIIEDKIASQPEETPESIAEIKTDFIPEFQDLIFEKAENVQEEKSGVNLNDKMTKNASLTLNDRVAFEQNLFDGSTEDLNRVISQLSTFGKFEEAKQFIDEMVKPDYNFWKGKDEFAERFMEFVESKFV